MKRGMTLVELIVAIGIVTVVMTGLTEFFIYLWGSKYDEISRGQSMLAASQSVSKMGENIRKAAQADSGSYAISSATGFDMVFYSDIDDDENRERVHYYLDGNSIMMGTAEPILGDNPTYPADDEEVSLITGNVMNGASDPIFTYLNYADEETSTLAAIRRVDLRVSVNVDPSRISNTVIETSIALRNLNK